MRIEREASTTLQQDATAVLVATRAALWSYWNGRVVCVIAQYLDEYYDKIFSELHYAGANVRAVLTAGRATGWQAPAGLEVFEILEAFAAAPFFGWESVLESVPSRLAAWISEIDPAGRMVFLGSQFTGVGTICDRQVIGWRRPAWSLWEDKTVALSRLQALDIPTVRSTILEPGSEHLPAFARRVYRDAPVVIARGGIDRGGGGSLSVVTSLAALRDARRSVGSARARLSKFVHGTPCSIIGMVIRSMVVVLNPIEIVTLVDRPAGRFVFCGSSSRWRPDAAVAAAMQTIAREVGEALSTTEGFLGGFSVDGILGVHGFQVTEVNARNATGLRLRHVWPDFPAYLFQRSIVESSFNLGNLDPLLIEKVFRGLTMQTPSHSIMVPMAKDRPSEGTIEIRNGNASVAVRYRSTRNSGGARILDVEGLLDDGRLGPIAAALTVYLGRTEFSYAGSVISDGATGDGGRSATP